MLKLNATNQITIPRDIRRKLNIKAGDSLVMNVQDGVIILIPQPKRLTDYLLGLHRELWKDIDVQKYLDSEHGAWVVHLLD